MTFSTNILSQSLEACAINPKQALVSAGQVQAAISSTGIKEIDYKSLRKLIYQCLRDHYSDDAANRYLAWRQFYDSGRPMIILIGGTTSTGKSIVAAELAYRLDIARTQSTDMMREIIRSYLAPHVAPTLQYSSYEAWRGLSTTNSGDTNRIVTGFLSQLATMKPAIQTTIASAIREKEHLILEGVHVLPTEIDIEQAENKAVVLPFMLAVLDKGVLRKRLTKRLRDASDQLGVERQESIDAIWKQQSWLLDVADVESIPILPNTEIEDTICDILELVSAEIVRRFPPDPAHLERDQ
jgi:2-phosphoglycerate kinase